MDPILIIEVCIVAIIVGLQFLVYFKNTTAIKKLAKIFPDVQFLQLKTTGSEETEKPVKSTAKQIEDNPKFSQPFREIIYITNAYLTKNKGEAEIESLQELAERKVVSQERAIDSNITLPLYIGLLCTFTGVIIGLVKIGIVGVSDYAIQSFIGGVLIGMVGSATGLGLTVRSNYQFKESKKKRDEGQYDYFTFLRAYIIPPLKKETQEPLSTLRENLAAFNEGFAQYQAHMNESLSTSLRLFSDVKEVFAHFTSLEQGLLSITNFLQANDGLYEKQVEYLSTYSDKAQALTQKLAQHYAYADMQLEAFVEDNINAINNGTQTAYAKVDQYLANGTGKSNGNGRYNGNGHGYGYANAYKPNLNGSSAQLQKENIELHKEVLKQLKDGNQLYEGLGDEIRMINARLAESVMTQEKSFMNSREFKFFIYLGLAAFIGSIAGGIVSMINAF